MTLQQAETSASRRVFGLTVGDNGLLPKRDGSCVNQETPDALSIGAILEDIIISMTQHLQEVVLDTRVIARELRLESSIYHLMIKTSDGWKEFVAKKGKDTLHQAELANWARSRFTDDPTVFLPECFVSHTFGFLISEKFSGASLGSLCLCRPGITPLSFRTRLRAAIRKTGSWLRRFHLESMTQNAMGSRVYESFLDNRSRFLDLLPRQDAHKLRRWARNAISRDTAVNHGDFSPQNILLKDDRICVIDFGLGEWLKGPPAWDVAAMFVGIRRTLETSSASPYRFFPAIARRVCAEFISAYGCMDSRSIDFIWRVQSAISQG